MCLAGWYWFIQTFDAGGSEIAGITHPLMPARPHAALPYRFEKRRSRNISPNEIYRFTTPRPLIAPRTYMFPQY